MGGRRGRGRQGQAGEGGEGEAARGRGRRWRRGRGRGRAGRGLGEGGQGEGGGGGQVRAFQAPAPLGPYTYTGDITRGANPFGTGEVTTSSQQTSVFRVGSQLVWVGDRWQSAPAPARFKGEDFTAWFLLGFAEDGAVNNITWRDDIQIEI